MIPAMTIPSALPRARVAARKRLAAAVALFASLGLAGCGTLPPLRVMAGHASPAPRIEMSADGKYASTTVSVLTYNIEGLGWPARSDRAPQLKQIGKRLAAMRAAGTAPDVVLFQEMFSGPAKDAVLASDYPAIATGPRRTTRAIGSTGDRLPGKSRMKRGEIGLHFTGGGLAVASRYRIAHVDLRAYGRRSCAGLDCLANKGIMLARIAIPGVPTPIDIYNTHMNSRGASRAPARRNLAAHDRQALEASEFIDATHDDAFPVVFGGDFNMRHSQERWDNFSRYQSLKLVHRICADPLSQCDVRLSWDGDAPWMDTQDLQFFWEGDQVAIRPIRVEAMFDGGPSGPKLSDHDGFKVTYRLTWPVAPNGRHDR
jgi:endonuclease/exonuclease/phosphatase family metal-dependent hydrolase